MSSPTSLSSTSSVINLERRKDKNEGRCFNIRRHKMDKTSESSKTGFGRGGRKIVIDSKAASAVQTSSRGKTDSQAGRMTSGSMDGTTDEC